jgi:hypothetical protein
MVMRTVNSPINKPGNQGLWSNPRHVPPPASTARGNAYPLPAAIEAALAVSLNGRDLCDPDPHPPVSRPK